MSFRSASIGFANPACVTAATIELYSRLWQALEDLATAYCRSNSAAEIERLVLLLRLELVLLLEAFADGHCRSLLRPDQRNQVCATVQSLLTMLSFLPGAGDAALAAAQNELFDAVMELLRSTPSAAPQFAAGNTD